MTIFIVFLLFSSAVDSVIVLMIYFGFNNEKYDCFNIR